MIARPPPPRPSNLPICSRSSLSPAEIISFPIVLSPPAQRRPVDHLQPFPLLAILSPLPFDPLPASLGPVQKFLRAIRRAQPKSYVVGRLLSAGSKSGQIGGLYIFPDPPSSLPFLSFPFQSLSDRYPLGQIGHSGRRLARPAQILPPLPSSTTLIVGDPFVSIYFNSRQRGKNPRIPAPYTSVFRSAG